MRRSAVLSPLAEHDLSDLWAYIALERQAPLSADRFLERVHRLCRRLAKAPGSGRRRDELGPGIRSFPVGRYLVFYRETQAGVEVVRVLSGELDLGPLFGSLRIR